MSELLARPWDSDLRRVEADALMEKGDPRGEYVNLAMKVHDELEEHGALGDEGRAFERRCALLLRAHERSWSGSIPALPFIVGSCFVRSAPSYRYSRGYPEILSLAGANIRAENLESFAAIAPLAGLVLRDASAAQLRTLVGHRCIENLARLEIACAPEPDEDLAEPIRALLSRAPHVRALRFTGAKLGALGVRAILESVPADLRSLSLRVPAASALACGLARLQELRSLEISAALGKEAALLAKSGALAKVRNLALTDGALGAKSLAIVLAAIDRPRLRVLDLRGAKIAPAGAEHLASGGLDALQILDLGENRLGEALGRISGEAFPDLRTLRFSHAGLKDEGLATLVRGEWPRLEELVVAQNGIGPAGMKALGESAVGARLKHLDLTHNKFHNEGMNALVAAQKLAIESLVLGHNWLGVKALRALLLRPDLAGLRVFRNGENNFGSEAAKIFVRGGHPALEEANLQLDADLAIALAESEASRSLFAACVTSDVASIGEAGARAFVTSKNMEGMRDLGFLFAVDRTEHESLRARFGNYVWFWPS